MDSRLIRAIKNAPERKVYEIKVGKLTQAQIRKRLDIIKVELKKKQLPR